MNTRTRFLRRDILKLMTAVPGAAAMSFAPAVAAAAPSMVVPENSSAGPEPKVLNAHESKTIRLLCDLIIPADENSGSATQAGVPEFIDDWLEFKGAELTTQIRGGLAWLDRESQRSFGKDFIDCDEAQQKQMLDRIAFPQKAAPADASGVAFFDQLRDLVVAGFFTAAVGIKDLPYLGNEPRAEWNGCPPAVLTKLGLAKEEPAG
ncbi:MAG TPA: gluconate 2-dehydrogenase subunit 3 family protein [Terriglobia bacterium]|nr:gluconate 2-dehydrogenase subunit 3 family protein [Terriglobia bacterium]